MSLPPPQIILFGDSLIEQSFSVERHGVGAALANAYARRADVLNRGLSGYNSNWLLDHYLETILGAYASANIIMWIILVGANDACLPGFVHHVPVSQFKENLEKMIVAIQRQHKCKVLVLSPPPIDKRLLESHGPRGGADRDLGVTRSYASAAKEVVEVGKWNSVGFLDFYELLWEELKNEGLIAGNDLNLVKEYLTDGLHLGPKGYELMYDTIMKKIKQDWPEICPEGLSMTAPWWGDLQDGRVKQHDEL
ncbi:SGNH hydrolase-type esterase domain-containing protein [Geopyxis carbonaria]|nr:SGNH hydrolase-type esterase domain-containing protein [Geopyxis carbonaria]